MNKDDYSLEQEIASGLEQELKWHVGENNSYGGEWLVGDNECQTYMDKNGEITCYVKTNDHGEPTKIKKFKFTILVEEILEK